METSHSGGAWKNGIRVKKVERIVGAGVNASARDILIFRTPIAFKKSN